MHNSSKDETPLLSDVIFNFIEAKDATGGISPAYRARIKNRLACAVIPKCSAMASWVTDFFRRNALICFPIFIGDLLMFYQRCILILTQLTKNTMAAWMGDYNRQLCQK